MLEALVYNISYVMIGVAGQGGDSSPDQAVHQLPPVLAVQGPDQVGPGLKVRIILPCSEKQMLEICQIYLLSYLPAWSKS